jgi:hypothetical protein
MLAVMKVMHKICCIYLLSPALSDQTRHLKNLLQQKNLDLDNKSKSQTQNHYVKTAITTSNNDPS